MGRKWEAEEGQTAGQVRRRTKLKTKTSYTVELDKKGGDETGGERVND